MKGRGETDPDAVDPERIRQLRAQAEARAAFLREVELLDIREAGERLAPESPDPSEVVNRLTAEGKLFQVTHRGAALYPAAQIVEGKPSPAVPRLLEAFSGDSPWSLALWLNAPSGWLDGRRPIGLLATEPDRVVEAARRATEARRF